jgi:phosphoenolpyruvate carboxykinase (ATP)
LTCPGVPSELLSPRETWKNDEGFYKKANELARKFNTNFEKFKEFASEEILSGGPKPNPNYE